MSVASSRSLIFRVIKQHINNAVKAKKVQAISKRLEQFTNDPLLSPDYLNIESAKITANAKKILKSVDSLYEQVNSIDVQEYFGEEAMWNKLESLIVLIRGKLKELGRRQQ